MIITSTQHRRKAIFLWVVFVVLCGIIIGRSPFSADMSAFLPRNPTPGQQLLLEQIRDGLASRLILTGIEGADAPARAALSRHMALSLRANTAFAAVNNGEAMNNERDRVLWFNNRYLLSPMVTAERFSVDGLRQAIGDSIERIASPAGMLLRSLLARDPTGEMTYLLEQLSGDQQPPLTGGVWASRDGARALLLIRTRALGSDTDAQQRAMEFIRQAFDAARTATPDASKDARLLMTGPGVFSVTSRNTIKREVEQLSLISIAIIVTVLLLVYRSATALALGLLPVVSGVLAGIAAVGLGFGVVHGITLGFGTALIGEAVDYSIYLFVQSEQSGPHMQDWVNQFWPTVRLGVLTSIAGFASLLLSGFPGLAQLGLYAIAGLVVAAVVTRFVLPQIMPVDFRIHDVSAVGVALSSWVKRAATLRWPAVLAVLAAGGVLIVQRAQLWDHSLSSLSPVSQAEVDLDTRLRADLGAPDTRYLVVVSASSREATLQEAEKAAAILQQRVDAGELAAFETPTSYLPSEATQRARQLSLPEPAELESRLPRALEGLPLRAERLASFVEDVARARQQVLLKPADLEQTSMALALDALLMQRAGHWSALLPLTPPSGGEVRADAIRSALQAATLQDAFLVDLKTEANEMYSGYLREAIVLSLGGLATLVTLLLVVLHSPMRVLCIIVPLAAAVITVAAGLTVSGTPMTLLHLVGLLLVVAIGSNYALFFDRPRTPHATAYTAGISPRTLASMLLANITTVAGFGLLAFSKVSILQALGVTVAPGVVLALIYAAIFARAPHVE